MTSTAETSEQIKALLSKAQAPLTVAEVADATGRASKTDTRKLLERVGAISRTLNTPGMGRSPQGWAMSAATLERTHALETGTAPARKATAPRRPAARATVAAATTRKRSSTTARKRSSTANRTDKPEAATAGQNAARRPARGARFERTPYTSPDGSPILTDDTGNLYVARPLVERHGGDGAGVVFGG